MPAIAMVADEAYSTLFFALDLRLPVRLVSIPCRLRWGERPERRKSLSRPAIAQG